MAIDYDDEQFNVMRVSSILFTTKSLMIRNVRRGTTLNYGKLRSQKNPDSLIKHWCINILYTLSVICKLFERKSKKGGKYQQWQVSGIVNKRWTNILRIDEMTKNTFRVKFNLRLS